MGVQYTAEVGNGMSLVPRVDISLTGKQYGNIFNGRINRIEPFVQANAVLQLNGADERWFVRGFVQNIFDSNSVTGLYVTDASSGNFTNIYTLDRSEEHTSELQSLMRFSYAVYCLKKKRLHKNKIHT